MNNVTPIIQHRNAPEPVSVVMSRQMYECDVIVNGKSFHVKSINIHRDIGLLLKREGVEPDRTAFTRTATGKDFGGQVRDFLNAINHIDEEAGAEFLEAALGDGV
ncbi:hypothetical protein [Primorskyibacter sp. S87]|uniref:hypothetical protein n=1 Tax=Primorskyibacter sp. S87 TaxID=3415126 RepID=UPI003C7CADAE